MSYRRKLRCKERTISLSTYTAARTSEAREAANSRALGDFSFAPESLSQNHLGVLYLVSERSRDSYIYIRERNVYIQILFSPSEKSSATHSCRSILSSTTQPLCRTHPFIPLRLRIPLLPVYKLDIAIPAAARSEIGSSRELYSSFADLEFDSLGVVLDVPIESFVVARELRRRRRSRKEVLPRRLLTGK